MIWCSVEGAGGLVCIALWFEKPGVGGELKPGGPTASTRTGGELVAPGESD